MRLVRPIDSGSGRLLYRDSDMVPGAPELSPPDAQGLFRGMGPVKSDFATALLGRVPLSALWKQ